MHLYQKDPHSTTLIMVRTFENYEELFNLGYAGYAFYHNSLCVLDRFGDLDCHASFANSSRDAIDIWGNQIFPNSRAHISTTHFGLVTSFSTRAIYNLKKCFTIMGIYLFIYPDETAVNEES